MIPRTELVSLAGAGDGGAGDVHAGNEAQAMAQRRRLAESTRSTRDMVAVFTADLLPGWLLRALNPMGLELAAEERAHVTTQLAAWRRRNGFLEDATPVHRSFITGRRCTQLVHQLSRALHAMREAANEASVAQAQRSRAAD